jgi:Glycosyltransferase family 87
MSTPPQRPPHTPSRFALYGMSCLIAQFLVIAILVARHYVLGEKNAPAFGQDFVVYWAAARVALEHGAVAVYSREFMAPVEMAVLHDLGYGPWAYPPTFLLFVFPFGFLPFGVALVGFLAVTIALFACSLHAIARPTGICAWRFALAFPAFFVVVAFGQNSFLTVAIAGAALLFLPKRPVLAGAFIALLSIKPQLGLLFPPFLICGRQWRAFTSAAVFTLLFLALSTFAFGTDTITLFLHALTAFNREWMEKNTGGIWFALTSVYGVARVAGATSIWAYGAHVVVALPAIFSAAWLWIRNARYELRAAALPVAAMLAPPYIIVYDLAWLALTIAFLAVDMNKHGASRTEIAIVVAAWFLPAQALTARWFPFIGQWSPAVLLTLLGLIILRHTRARQTLLDLGSQTAPAG